MCSDDIYRQRHSNLFNGNLLLYHQTTSSMDTPSCGGATFSATVMVVYL